MADKKIDDDDDGNVDDDGDDGMMMMTRFNWLQDKWSFVGSNLMPGQTDGRRQRHCHDDDELSMIQAVF